MPAKRSWRINPSAFIEHHVERLAKEESRSLSNMMERLLTEAIAHRRQAQSANVAHLVQILRAPADEAAQ